MTYVFTIAWFILYFHINSCYDKSFRDEFVIKNKIVKKNNSIHSEFSLDEQRYKIKKTKSNINNYLKKNRKTIIKEKSFLDVKKEKKSLIVVGERNSGTNMLYNALRECYGEKDVYQSFARDKHWQQDEYVFKTKNINKKMLNIYNSKNYIIFVQMRGVYNWVPAMQARPYEMPAHIAIKHNLTKFILKEWTMKKPKEDTQKNQCQGNFPTDKYVIPCIDYRGIYELDYLNGGIPFKNILDFRAAKIRNWLNMTKWNKHVFFLKLEDYYKNKTNFLVDIEKIVGLSCKNKQSFEVDFKTHNKHKVRVDPLFKYVSKKKSSENYFLTPAERYLIQKLTHWELEKQVGYTDEV